MCKYGRWWQLSEMDYLSKKVKSYFQKIKWSKRAILLGRYEIVKEILGSPNLKKSEKPWSNSSVV